MHGWEQSNVLVKVDSSVRELAERSSLLELGGLLGVLYQNQVSSAPSLPYFPFFFLFFLKKKKSSPLILSPQQHHRRPSFLLILFFFSGKPRCPACHKTKGREGGQIKRTYSSAMIAVGVLIEGTRLSTRKYRRAKVVAVMRNLLAKGGTCLHY